MKQKAKHGWLLSSPPRAWMATTRPPPGIQGNVRNVTLSFTSLLFLRISIRCHCATVACMHACMHGPPVNAWSLRGTPSPGSSAIFPIIKQWSAISFPCPPRFPWRWFGCFPFITALIGPRGATGPARDPTVPFFVLFLPWYVPVFSVYLLASRVFNWEPLLKNAWTRAARYLLIVFLILIFRSLNKHIWTSYVLFIKSCSIIGFLSNHDFTL